MSIDQICKMQEVLMERYFKFLDEGNIDSAARIIQALRELETLKILIKQSS